MVSNGSSMRRVRSASRVGVSPASLARARRSGVASSRSWTALSMSCGDLRLVGFRAAAHWAAPQFGASSVSSASSAGRRRSFDRLREFRAQSRRRGAIGQLKDGGYEFRQAAGVDPNVRREVPVGALQVLEMTGGRAYGFRSLGVDFWWTAPARRRGGHGSCPFCFAVLCSCFVQYRAKQKVMSRFCFFELRFFGNEVNTVSRQVHRWPGRARAPHAFHLEKASCRSFRFDR